MLHCLDLGLIDYTEALALQEELVSKRWKEEIDDTLLMLEHPPVFTLGRGGNPQNVLQPGAVPVHRVGRGGDVTFHGPGQLVGYPIIHLAAHGRDVHAYLRGLEKVLIAMLARYGIAARQQTGLTGVWVGEQKIASIGVGVRRWVTYHGFALNVAPNLAFFRDIVPCGLAGVRMTSMAAILSQSITVGEIKPLVAEIFARFFGYEDCIWQNNYSANW